MQERAPVVVVHALLTVYGIDGYTGRHLWQHEVPLPPRIWTVGDVVIVVSHGIFCFRLATGEVVWQREGYGDTVAVAHGLVVVAGSGVTALAVDDGRVLWHDKSLRSAGALAIEGGPSVQLDKS